MADIFVRRPNAKADRAMNKRAAIMSLSIIYLPEDVKLRLVGGVVARNPEADIWWNSPEDHPAYVVPEGQSDPTLAQVRDHMDSVALPLRLGTPATLTLAGLKVAEGSLEGVMASGIHAGPRVTYGINRFVRLTTNECHIIETA